MVRQHKKIKEFQKRECPITYSTLQINSRGKFEEYSSKLDERIVCGYGVIWGSRNDYGEKFVKGCFAKSISEQGPGSNAAFEIKFKDRHGKSCSLFAKLTEDDIGLYFETVPLDNVQWANDVLTQIRSKTLNNFSIGFLHCWDRVEWDDADDSLINLEARLFEISVVDIPSDMETYAVRSVEEREYLNDDIDEFITNLPKSKQLEARKIFTRCMTPNLDTPPKAPVIVTPSKKGIDYNYLNQNL